MKRKMARYTLDPAQIALFPPPGGENAPTRTLVTHAELPPAPGTGVKFQTPHEKTSVEVKPEEILLPMAIPTLYCAVCGGRGVSFQSDLTGLGGIEEVPCLHCGGTGLITQGCNPARKLSTYGNQKSQAEEANTVSSPHAWCFPSPSYATCLTCKLSALTLKEPDPLDLMEGTRPAQPASLFPPPSKSVETPMTPSE